MSGRTWNSISALQLALSGDLEDTHLGHSDTRGVSCGDSPTSDQNAQFPVQNQKTNLESARGPVGRRKGTLAITSSGGTCSRGGWRNHGQHRMLALGSAGQVRHHDGLLLHVRTVQNVQNHVNPCRQTQTCVTT